MSGRMGGGGGGGGWGRIYVQIFNVYLNLHLLRMNVNIWDEIICTPVPQVLGAHLFACYVNTVVLRGIQPKLKSLK